MKTITVGARKLLNEDIVFVSHFNARVELDPSTLDRCGKSHSIASDGKSCSTYNEPDFDFDSPTDDQFFTIEEIRASMFARICNYMQGRVNISKEVIEFLTECLNRGVCPIIPKNSMNSEGKMMLDLMRGIGQCFTKNGKKSAKSAFLEEKVKVPEQISDGHGKTIVSRSFLEIGLLCCASFAAINFVNATNATVCFGLEAIFSNLDAFQSANFDTFRQQRGQIETAEVIRLFLAGSKMTKNTKNSSKNCEIFDLVPQYVGPALDLISMAYKIAETELNSTENGPIDGTIRPLHMQQVKSAQNQLLHAMKILKNGSVHRTKALKSEKMVSSFSNFSFHCEIETSQNFDKAKGNDQFGLNTIETMRELRKSLSEELNKALTIILAEEDKIIQKNALKQAKMEEKMASISLSKEIIKPDYTGLTPQQIEKRKEKSELKLKAKSLKKSDDKSILGDGTAELKKFILSKSKSSCTNPEEIHEILNPFDTSENSFCTFYCNVLNRLNVGGTRRKPKLPKGTRDQNPDQMVIREEAFQIIRKVFKRHGAVEIDTPVFELKSTLTGKYGEDQKLIYDLADQGGELLALRYDLTVPFARYLAMNNDIGNIKRFHIAKVYRRDQPNLTKGRYREFYQCDFDIAGTYGEMVPDSEAISVACEILSELPIGDFKVKLNHRKLLDAILNICGCPSEKFRSICSAIDKLDKSLWEDVKKEMVEEKGLSIESADRIGTFVTFHGPPIELWEELSNSKLFGDNKDASVAMEELKTLFKYLEAIDTLKFIEFDLSLARGLTYYTGLIYECVVIDGDAKIGSIAAGGRYDNLVGMFSGMTTPCVGVSIGIERVFTIMEAKKVDHAKRSSVQVFVAGVGPDLLPFRMKIAQILWKCDIPTEFNHQLAPKLKPQLTEVLERNIPFMLIVGEEEFRADSVRIKDMGRRTEDLVKIGDIAGFLVGKGCLLAR